MNLRPFVNDKHLYDDFLEELDGRITVLQKTLEQSTYIEDVYRTQGAIDSLRKLKTLRDKVNYGTQHG
jgi:hypothetical protein